MQLCFCGGKKLHVIETDVPLVVSVSSLDQDWGRPGDLLNLGIQWHVPSTEEKEFVFYLLDLLLKPELERLQKHAQGEQDISRSATGYGNMLSV